MVERYGMIDEASGYSPVYFGETPEGDYVSYSDYAQSERELVEARKRISELEIEVNFHAVKKVEAHEAETRLQEKLAEARAETLHAKTIISKACNHLPNGAFCSPEASLDFMERVPDEVLIVTSGLVNKITAAEAERDHLAADLRKPFLGVFLDGRNEHGSHVIASSQTSISGELERDAIELLADQSAGVAEAIIKAAEAAGYEIGMCVAVTWKLDKYLHDNGEVETAVADPKFSEPLTLAFYGSADEQRRASLQTGEKGE